jgi:hypothetical protein
MSPSAAAAHRQPDDREGLSPSPEAPYLGVVTIADLLDEDDDDIEFEPSTEQTEISDAVEDDDEDGNEYVGMGLVPRSPLPRRR